MIRVTKMPLIKCALGISRHFFNWLPHFTRDALRHTYFRNKWKSNTDSLLGNNCTALAKAENILLVFKTVFTYFSHMFLEFMLYIQYSYHWKGSALIQFSGGSAQCFYARTWYRFFPLLSDYQKTSDYWNGCLRQFSQLLKTYPLRKYLLVSL